MKSKKVSFSFPFPFWSLRRHSREGRNGRQLGALCRKSWFCLFNFLCILKSVQEIPVEQNYFAGGFSFLLGTLQYNFSVTKCFIAILQRHFVYAPNVFFTLRCGVDNSWSSSFSSLFTGAVCNSSITYKIKIPNLKIKGVHQRRSCVYISVEWLLRSIIHQSSVHRPKLIPVHSAWNLKETKASSAIFIR